MQKLANCCVKGIVHPKMKILSSFTHPQVVPNLFECLCSAEHKGRYPEECGKQSRSGAPLTSIVFFFSYYGSQWCPKTAWLQTFFKISSFVFGRTKKFIQVWNYLRVSKWWQNFHFWVNYPLNSVLIHFRMLQCEIALAYLNWIINCVLIHFAFTYEYNLEKWHNAALHSVDLRVFAFANLHCIMNCFLNKSVVFTYLHSDFFFVQ